MSCDCSPLEFNQTDALSSESGKAIGEIVYDAKTREIIAFLVAFRKRRAEVFSRGYFSDPAWDILLDLADAESNGGSLCVTQLGLDSSCPTATVIRHVNKLLKDGFIIRKKDDYDRRKTYVVLTKRARSFLIKCATIDCPLDCFHSDLESVSYRIDG